MIHTVKDQDSPEEDLLKPRCYATFYFDILKKVPIRKRPPDKYCVMCESRALILKHEKLGLMIAECKDLEGSDVEKSKHAFNWGKYKTQEDAMKAYRNMGHLVRRRRRHKAWYRSQRRVVKNREESLRWDELVKEVLLYLDYGTIYDSAGKHVDIWSATLVACPKGEKAIRYFNIFYEKLDRPPGEPNKNSNTGRMCLKELLDPACNVESDSKTSVLQELFPGATNLILSGDTGNGFRGLPMSYYHTMLWKPYQLLVELMILPPRHAFNLTDAHLAHLNIFFRKLMRLSFLHGPKEFCEALQRATSPRVMGARKLIKNVIARYRVFYPKDYIRLPKEQMKGKTIMKQVNHYQHIYAMDIKIYNIILSLYFQNLEFGVMSLGYFNCTVAAADGSGSFEVVEGIMRVREYADDTLDNNPMMVFNMLSKDVCQRCSNKAVSSFL
jgi:hypothetical protein